MLLPVLVVFLVLVDHLLVHFSSVLSLLKAANILKKLEISTSVYSTKTF